MTFDTEQLNNTNKTQSVKINQGSKGNKNRPRQWKCFSVLIARHLISLSSHGINQHLKEWRF